VRHRKNTILSDPLPSENIKGEPIMTRQDYERRFHTYPDVVTLPEFCAMLRIGDNYARRLLRKNLVAHFVIRHTYYIPKENVIDFVLSPNYLQVLNRFRRDNR
jgi:hypothetical protein